MLLEVAHGIAVDLATGGTDEAAPVKDEDHGHGTGGVLAVVPAIAVELREVVLVTGDGAARQEIANDHGANLGRGGAVEAGHGSGPLHRKRKPRNRKLPRPGMFVLHR